MDFCAANTPGPRLRSQPLWKGALFEYREKITLAVNFRSPRAARYGRAITAYNRKSGRQCPSGSHVLADQRPIELCVWDCRMFSVSRLKERPSRGNEDLGLALARQFPVETI
jgi:hypothetical protein